MLDVLHVPDMIFNSKIEKCPAGFDFTYNGHCYYYYGDFFKSRL